MIKAVVAGVAGRMGRTLLSILMEEDVEIVGATERAGHSVIGEDAGVLAGVGVIDVSVSDEIEAAGLSADVIIDFTIPSATLANAEYASQTKKSMVIGTTGYSEDEENRLRTLAQGFPCVLSPNMSVGVNVMFEFARKMAELLGDDFDAEIIEAHHRHKADSPSGTALMLGKEVAKGLGREFNDIARFERFGRIGERKKGEIGIQSVRGGDITGDHTLMLCGNGERLELVHRASSRVNFAKGAVRAAKWIVGKPAGIYSMKDVLGI